uniref:Single-stranded-DNA-specific exonuclease recJ n=1 Tax=uncultured organism TaxID=155900 RepID=M1PWT5_9ZZZZ|nr:single-stranded-DNA-specific exonuclease recJ [uncultured organism]
MKKKARQIAEKLLSHDKIKIISHIDADGITSGSIAYKALMRRGKDVDIDFIKQLEKSNIEKIKEEDPELVWFTDLGSGQIPFLNGIDCVITDHHEPAGDVDELPKKDRGNILNYTDSNILELNPHRYDIDGANELCGAGTTYLVAKELGEGENENVDLSKLAVIGAIGDLQATKEGKLIGVNRDILEEGVSEGIIEKKTDTLMYGLESRPLSKVLEYASDPILPGLTGDNPACVNFLVENDISVKENDEWRRWYELEKSEKRTILSDLAKRMLNRGYPPSYVDELIGEVYMFPDEERGTMLHEAKEFSTLLNSCGRYGKGRIGLEVCLGDRDEYLEKAKDLLKGHQKVLVDCMKYVESVGVEEKDHIQFFHGRDMVPDTVVGTVAGMVLGSVDVDRTLPIIAFADSEEKGTKVSSRGTKRLVEKGLDLSEIMSKCSKEVGGEGGGHDIAAGAYIPEDKEDEFISKVEDMVKDQLH